MSAYNVTVTVLMYIIPFNPYNPLKTQENYFLSQEKKFLDDAVFLKNFIKMVLTNQGKAYLPVKEISLFNDTSEKYQREFGTITWINSRVPGFQF